MPSQTGSPKPAPTILNLLCGHFDLVSSLAEVMADQKQYASLAALSTINREYHVIIKPFLKSTKKRIVVDLSDLRKLPKSRYKEIEIIECGPHSAIPEEIHVVTKKRGRSRYDAGFRPWLMTFRGRPERYLPQLQENFAPGVDVIRVVDGPRKQTSVETSYNLRDRQSGSDCYDWISAHQIYDDYIQAFFVDSPSRSLRASNFRYQATQESRANGTHPNPKVVYEIDMVSALGNIWQYRREEITGDDVFEALCSAEHCDCIMCLDYNAPFGVSAQIYIPTETKLTNSPCLYKQFNDLSFPIPSEAVLSVALRTHVYTPVGVSLNSSLQNRMSYCEFGEKVRKVANRRLKLSESDAKVTFDLYVHHGHHTQTALRDMKPVFSSRIC